MIDFENYLRDITIKNYDIKINECEIENLFINKYLDKFASELLKSSFSVQKFLGTIYVDSTFIYDSLLKSKLTLKYKFYINSFGDINFEMLGFSGQADYKKLLSFVGALYADMNKRIKKIYFLKRKN